MQHDRFARGVLVLVFTTACGGDPPPDRGPSRAAVVAGAGRVRVGTLALDVEIGRPGFTAKAGSTAIDSASVIGGAR